MATLIIFSGLSGTGKTTIARELAHQIGAVYLRIDSIEQAMRDSDRADDTLSDAGYRVAYAVAEDNLRLGRTVVSDSVNPLTITRNAWLDVARRSGARALEIEVLCSKEDEHRRRVEQRTSDIPGLRLPTWAEAISREYHRWDRERLVLDTAVNSPEQCLALIQKVLREGPAISR